MPKHKEYTILLISRGIWDESLHFGPFCHNWWLSRPVDKTNDIIPLYPIRLHFKTLVILNEREFITEVVRIDSAFGPHPGYICKCDGVKSEVCETATVAISSVYRVLFKTGTKIPGPEVLGFDMAIITNELLSDLPFRLYNFQLGSLRIWIIKIGCSDKITTNLAGPGFKSAFIYQYKKKRALFYQEIDEYHCKVIIFYGSDIHATFIDQNPDLVWSKIGILQQYDGKKLFGLINQHTKDLIQAARIPSCTLNEWYNKEVMTNIYNYHLKRRVLAEIDWHYFFVIGWSNPIRL